MYIFYSNLCLQFSAFIYETEANLPRRYRLLNILCTFFSPLLLLIGVIVGTCRIFFVSWIFILYFQYLLFEFNAALFFYIHILKYIDIDFLSCMHQYIKIVIPFLKIIFHYRYTQNLIYLFIRTCT